jgi:hypothetical protein
VTDDPGGLYAALGVDPAATHETIVAAFRRKARVLHPDVPETGDAEAFIRVKQAYEVLGNAGRRADYDRSRRGGSPTTVGSEAARQGLHLSDMPIALWVALGGLVCVAGVLVAVQFSRPSRAPPQSIRLSSVLPAPVVAPAPQSLTPGTGGGPTTHYVLPSGEDAVLWRYDAARDIYLPAGHVAAFSTVRALRLLPLHGLVEIGLADGGSGFLEAERLTPGDRAAARRSFCAYNAGAPPGNGEVLERHGDGSGRVEISNRGALPVAIKLRDTAGRSAAMVFVSPGNNARVDHLPDTTYQPEFAIGDLWSRACNSFVAGMRAQRFAGYASLPGLTPLVIPPDLSVGPAPVDIPDEAFERE